MTFTCFTLGCKVNAYENAALASLLINNGYQECKEGSPDIIIINTCSVTATADQKSRQHIRKFKKNYPNAIIVVMGCYAQGNSSFIFNELKPDILIGTSNRNKIPDLLNQYFKNKEPINAVMNNPLAFEYEDFGVTSFCENTRAYLKIQDGCSNFCTYCVVPYRRGKMRSRDPLSVIKEAKHLVSNGYQEIVLSGIHVGGYGKDLKDICFSSLVEQLLDIKGLNSLRISSIEESEIDDKLITLLKTRNNLAKHLHIPLQSGSSNILTKMNRKYTKEEFVSKLIKIKNEVKDICLTTDVIVGFPGETEDDFKQTFEVCEKCFNMLHVFPYSPREGTIASKMEDQISPNVKSERAKILLDLSNNLYEKFSSCFVGQYISVLVEQFDKQNYFNIGHTSNYIKVKIPNKESNAGSYISIKLEKSMIMTDKN